MNIYIYIHNYICIYIYTRKCRWLEYAGCVLFPKPSCKNPLLWISSTDLKKMQALRTSPNKCWKALPGRSKWCLCFPYFSTVPTFLFLLGLAIMDCDHPPYTSIYWIVYIYIYIIPELNNQEGVDRSHCSYTSLHPLCVGYIYIYVYIYIHGLLIFIPLY